MLIGICYLPGPTATTSMPAKPEVIGQALSDIFADAARLKRASQRTRPIGRHDPDQGRLKT